MRLVGQPSVEVPIIRHVDDSHLERTGVLHRPVWLLTGGIALLLLLAFGLLLYSSWRHDRELEPIAHHLDFVAMVESTDQLLRVLADEVMRGELDSSLVDYISARLEQLRDSKAFLHPRSGELTSATLAGMHAFLNEAGPGKGEMTRLRDARLLMRKVLANEMDAQKALLMEKRAVSRREQHIALGLLAGLLMVLIPLGRRIRHNIIRPLDTLGNLMTLMSRQDYTSAPTSNVDPMLLPLFENYNRMVNRLVTLEQAHQHREDSLAASIRQATRMLLKQQHRLAQAERLGAVGELAASVAHELRNPLTACHMALQNLRGDLRDPDLVSRVDLILVEIKRINQQLNALLENARQTPEQLSEVDVVAVLGELRTLVRYQASERVSVHIHAPSSVICRLPESQLRQCLLNLLLNSVQALGDEPGRIDVEVITSPGLVRLVVEDDGPGFPEEMLLGAMRPFGSWRRGGTGLGMAMVKRFVSDLGGILRIENRAPRGARVTIELPQGAIRHAADTAGH
jgi:two-component system NtrC family sensor kinase